MNPYQSLQLQLQYMYTNKKKEGARVFDGRSCTAGAAMVCASGALGPSRAPTRDAEAGTDAPVVLNARGFFLRRPSLSRVLQSRECYHRGKD